LGAQYSSGTSSSNSDRDGRVDIELQSHVHTSPRRLHYINDDIELELPYSRNVHVDVDTQNSEEIKTKTTTDTTSESTKTGTKSKSATHKTIDYFDYLFTYNHEHYNDVINDIDVVYRKPWNKQGYTHDPDDLHWSAYVSKEVALKYIEKYGHNPDDIVENNM